MRHDHRVGRRFAKRYGVSPLRYADRAFSTTGDGSTPCVVDHESLKPESFDGVTDLFGDLDVANGDVLVVFGWAMSEELAKFA